MNSSSRAQARSCAFHPQWHGIFLEGGFDLDGSFLHIPFGNLEKMAQAFRQRVLALFLELGLIQRDRAEGLLCWHRSGFGIDGSVGLYATNPAAMERLAQYKWSERAQPAPAI